MISAATSSGCGALGLAGCMNIESTIECMTLYPIFSATASAFRSVCLAIEVTFSYACIEPKSEFL